MLISLIRAVGALGVDSGEPFFFVFTFLNYSGGAKAAKEENTHCQRTKARVGTQTRRRQQRRGTPRKEGARRAPRAAPHPPSGVPRRSCCRRVCVPPRPALQTRLPLLARELALISPY